MMLHACKRFELHTFNSFREMKTNSLLPRITDQQLRHFGTNGEFEKSESDNFRLLWEFIVATLDCNISRTAWPISAIHISLFSKFKALLYESNLYYLCSSPLIRI